MKLYRHHSKNHQEKIENANGSFVVDFERKFNFDGKNFANFYFYCTSVEGAEMYKIDENADEGSTTTLYTYEANELKLLNLAENKEHRAMLKNVINNYIEDSEMLLKKIEKENPKDFKGWLKRGIVFSVNTDDVIENSKVHNGRTYWGQMVTDYERGVILKKELEKLGYDGVIIKDGAYEEVALLKPAKLIK